MTNSSLLIACMTTALLALLVGCAGPASPSNRIAQLQRKVREIEEQCAPQKGTSQQEVEAIFGSGTPLPKSPSKMPPKDLPTADSPRRTYKLCENGTLVVRYDSDWNVLHANYPNPYSTKGRPIGAPDLTKEQQLHELEPRFKQMESILKAYKKRSEG
jgi:hypothetical protein